MFLYKGYVNYLAQRIIILFRELINCILYVLRYLVCLFSCLYEFKIYSAKVVIYPLNLVIKDFIIIIIFNHVCSLFELV
jgi:hypothetical protein